jgi:hypothetical protein
MAESAKGRAKTEWENLINSRVWKKRRMMLGRGPLGGEVMTTEEGMLYFSGDARSKPKQSTGYQLTFLMLSF